jgi:hypothetical protein
MVEHLPSISRAKGLIPNTAKKTKPNVCTYICVYYMYVYVYIHTYTYIMLLHFLFFKLSMAFQCTWKIETLS